MTVKPSVSTGNSLSRDMRRGFWSTMRCLGRRFLWQFSIASRTSLKRGVDIAVACTGLVFLSPLFLLIAVLIKCTDGGPVLFWQNRVGRWGVEFPFPKFRSMEVNAEARKDQLLSQNDHGRNDVTFKMRHDPRVTWIGRLIRRTSLDELPQLWCVFIGSMSLVGPRPPVPREVLRYTLIDRQRLEVTPGLTCIWQVSGRCEIPFPRQVELDLEYIRKQNFWLDVQLLLRTVPAVIFGKGAY